MKRQSEDDVEDLSTGAASKKRASRCDDHEVDISSPQGYTYHDHPADIQLHSWGTNMKEAMEQLVLAMYGYMVELDSVDEVYSYYFTASGHDEDSLIFSLLDEPLVAFQSEPFFIGKRIEVLEVNEDNTEVSFCAYGESFKKDKHKQLTDVKAITHSNMQIVRKDNRVDIFVIVDI